MDFVKGAAENMPQNADEDVEEKTKIKEDDEDVDEDEEDEVQAEALAKAQAQYEEEELQHTGHLLWTLVFYILLFISTTIKAIDSYDSRMYYFNKALEDLLFFQPTNLGPGTDPLPFEYLVTKDHFWAFLENNFFENLYGKGMKFNYQKGYYIFEENLLMGPPRMRQLRVRSNSCLIHPAFKQYFNNCYAAYSASTEETEQIFHGKRYARSFELNTGVINGKLGQYESGGYVENLSYDLNDTKNILSNLKENKWVDGATRLVLIEFTVFNENVYMFAFVKCIAEFPPTGGVLLGYNLQSIRLHSSFTQNNLTYLLIVSTVFTVLFITFLTRSIRRLIKVGPFLFFSRCWNIMNFFVGLILCACWLYEYWHNYFVREMQAEFEKDFNKYINFEKLTFWNSLYLNVLALCALFIGVIVLRYMSMNKTLLLFSVTLIRSSKDLLGFFCMYIVIFLSFAILGYTLFGSFHPDFQTFLHTCFSMVRAAMGAYDTEPISYDMPLVGPLFFASYIIIMYFILFNMFLAIISNTFLAVREEGTVGAFHIEDYIRTFSQRVFRRVCFVCLKVGQKWKRNLRFLTPHFHLRHHHLQEHTEAPATWEVPVAIEEPDEEETGPLNYRDMLIEKIKFQDDEIFRMRQTAAFLQTTLQQLNDHMDDLLQKVADRQKQYRESHSK